jgi:hypothetical protein
MPHLMKLSPVWHRFQRRIFRADELCVAWQGFAVAGRRMTVSAVPSSARCGPAFVLTADWPGVVGVRVVADGPGWVLFDGDVVVPQGGALIAPGTLQRGLRRVRAFELHAAGRVLARLPCGAANEAAFTGEGCIAGEAEFEWDEAAEAEYQRRLRLLGG